MRRLAVMLLTLTVVLGGLASPASAWEFILESFQPRAIAVDAKGDVVTTGQRLGDLVVEKLWGAEGSEAWRFVVQDASSAGSGWAVAIDLGDDVIVTGQVDDAFTVIKVSGTDGVELWRSVVGPGSGSALAVDSVGDVVALNATGTRGDPSVVVKLSGKDGSELWRVALGTVPVEAAVAVDGGDDAVVAGSYGGRFTVIKLAGADGGELWRRELAGNTGIGAARAVAIDLGGDVIAAGALFSRDNEPDLHSFWDLTVVRFAGADGTERWRTVVDSGLTPDSSAGCPCSEDIAHTVAIDLVGDVVVGGEFNGFDSHHFPWVFKFAGSDGIEQWRAQVPVGFRGFARAVPDPTGDVIVGSGSPPFWSAKLNRVSGARIWTATDDTGYAVEAMTVDDNGDVVFAKRGSRVSKLRGIDGGDF